MIFIFFLLIFETYAGKNIMIYDGQIFRQIDGMENFFFLKSLPPICHFTEHTKNGDFVRLEPQP